jgi:hypothetical protein
MLVFVVKSLLSCLMLASLSASGQERLVSVVDLTMAEVESLPQNIQSDGLSAVPGLGQAVIDGLFYGAGQEYQLIKVTVDGSAPEKGQNCQLNATGSGDLTFSFASFSEFNGKTTGYAGFEVSCDSGMQESVDIFISTENKDPEIYGSNSVISVEYVSHDGDARSLDVTVMEDHDMTGSGYPVGGNGSSITVSSSEAVGLNFYGQIDPELIRDGGVIDSNGGASLFIWLK